MTRVTPTRERKPAKRAFSGMVGRDAPAEVEKTDDKKFRHVPIPDQRLQSAQHDPDNFGAKRPEGTKHIPHGAKGFSKVVQDITGVTSGDLKNSGISTFDTGAVSRADTPAWIRDPKMLDEFFLRRWDMGMEQKSLVLSIVSSWRITTYPTTRMRSFSKNTKAASRKSAA